ncbi:hypothetical protein [Cohnella cholangitidis]|uniref:Tail fiber protein n=1 Tax=Cohnella cholangitidis TaxID=2598458 RepID=A0A7G5C3G7_9BACL|nr:hypothetical protein [Cohnella cholangitidis]QMV43751.1 hypothetical protein FPL14_23185 [Cohnella cholangitidis]
MPDITPNLGLKKPLGNENFTRAAYRENLDLIDANAAKKSDVGDMSAVPTTSKNAAGAITELFTNVSDGKALVAAAITDKGILTAVDDTFAEMAVNIEAIPVGPDTSDATATVGDILAPKTAYGSAGTKLTGTLALTGSAADADVLATKTFYNTDAKTKRTGTMVNRGAVSITPSASAQAIPAGYHNGSGTVAAVAVPAANVLTGTTIAGTAGTMPNRAGDTAALASSVSGTTLKLRTSNGYRDGVDDNVTITDSNFLADNIPEGLSMFGKTGTLKTAGVMLIAPTLRTTTSTTFVSLKKITVTYTGIVRISFRVGSINTGFFVNGQIYKNGVAVGIMRRTSGSIFMYTEDLPCNKGDYFEIMARIEASGTTCQIDSFQIQTVLTSPYNGTIDFD